MSRRCFLITGATGLVGGYIFERLARQSDDEIHLLVRAASEQAARQRVTALCDYFGRPELAHRIRIHTGCLCAPGVGLADGSRAELMSRVTDVVHAAASISFNDARTNRDVNLQGTEKLLSVVPRDVRFFYVSTAYVAGLAPLLREDQLDVGQAFRNDYEQSKFEAERLVRQAYGGSPELLTVLRPSIVIGEWKTGRTFQFMTLYRVLRALVMFAHRHPGETFSLPYHADGTQNYIPVDRLTDMACEVIGDAAHWGATYHLVNDAPITNHVFRGLIEGCLDLRIRNGFPGSEFSKLNRAAVAGNMSYLAYLDGEPVFDCLARNRLATSRWPMPFDQGYLERLLAYYEHTSWGRHVAISR